MSFLIDQECSVQYGEIKIKKTPLFGDSYRFSEGAIFKNYNIEQELKKSNFQFSFYDLTKLTRQYRVVLRGLLFGKYDIVFRMQIDYQNQTITQKIDVMREEQYLKVSNIKQKLLSVKELFKHKYSRYLSIKPVITPCGKIQIQLPFLHFGNLIKFMTERRTKLRFSDYILMRIHKVIGQIKHILIQLIFLVQNQKSKEIYQRQKVKNQNEERSKNDYQIRRYLARSSIDLLFDCTEGSALYQKIVNISIKQQEELGQMISAIKSGRDLRIPNTDLYCYMQDKNKKINLYQYFNLNPKERESIKIMLQFPPVKRSKNVNENKYIQNNIKIFQKEPQYIKLYPLAEGGFGKISVAEIQFWYQNSVSDEESQTRAYTTVTFTLKSLLKKYIVIKQANYLPASLQKIAHQKQIVSKLKCASSIFLPKYYVVTARQHAFHNHILIDYHQCGSLANLIQSSQSSQHSMSIQTVLYIMSQIAQGLRYLNQYKIVHLDLKPENVLLTKDFSVKIIDFGDSYHPQVCLDNVYTPGYTYPYGCPQLFDKSITEYTDKSDSFSIGMMLFQLIYGKYPISTSQKQFVKDIFGKQFCKRYYFIPEELQKYGQGYILPMINQLIFKCLDPNVHMRPSLNWMSVLLKKYLQEFSES